MPVTKSLDHIDRGVAKLLSRFQKPKNKAWLTAYLRQVQKLEDAAWEVLTLRYLDTAIGVQLDVLGKIVGRGRNGLDDPYYRLAIRTQIRINRSQGLTVDLVDVASLSVPDDTTIGIQEVAHMTTRFLFPVGDYDKDSVVYNLQKTKAGGARVRIVFETQSSASVFAYGWSGGTVERKGFGWSGDATVGGAMAYTEV